MLNDSKAVRLREYVVLKFLSTKKNIAMHVHSSLKLLSEEGVCNTITFIVNCKSDVHLKHIFVVANTITKIEEEQSNA